MRLKVLARIARAMAGREKSLWLSGNEYNSPWEYVHVKNSPSLSVEGEYTISSWIYRKDAGGDWRNLYDIPDAHLFEFSPSGGFDWRSENNNIDFNVNGPQISEGTWTHVAATMTELSDGSHQADVYVNGALASGGSSWQLGQRNNQTGVRDSDQDLYIGVLWSQRNGNADPWAGGIDDFKIWNKSLNAGQIKRVYEGKNVQRSSMVAEYTFDNDAGSTIRDTSGNNNHGTLISSKYLPSVFIFNGATIEEGQSGDIKIIRSGDTTRHAKVKLFTEAMAPDETARYGKDYFSPAEWLPGGKEGGLELSFSPGDTEKSFSIEAYEDHIEEEPENIMIWGITSDDPNYTVRYNSNQIWITDSPKKPASVRWDISKKSVNEGDWFEVNAYIEGAGTNAKFYWSVSGKGINKNDFIERWLSSPGSGWSTGKTSGWDTSANDRIEFAFVTSEDKITEGDETINIKLFSDSERKLQIGETATVTINDTSLTPAKSIFSIDGTNVWEGDTAQVLISRKGNTSAAVDLTVNTVNGTASSGTDYTQLKDKTIRFGAGTRSKKIFIGTREDSAVESDETFKVKISSNDDLAQFNNKSATVTIEDDDQAVINKTINTTNITNNTTNITNINYNTTTVVNTYARTLVGDVLTGSTQLNQNSYDAKFYNLGEGRYGIKRKGKRSIDEITGVTSLQFEDQALSVANDVAATFNQVKGMDDVSGVVFRLYNAAFSRLPDAKGLENWIAGNNTGGMTYATSAQEFSSSQEFKNRYGATTTDTQYITTLYNNVLGRSPDAAGLANYQRLLANGKDRGALLLDFSESPENRVLFTEVTGLS